MRDKIKEKRIVKKDYIISILLVIIFCTIIFSDGINDIRYQLIGYDESYNASVAANLIRYGEYRVSYPNNIVFYNMITTGTTVILPVALLFRLFGINSITVNIIPLIYATLSFYLLYKLFSKCLVREKMGYIWAALLSVMVFLSDEILPYISTNLVGEGACLFFLLLSCLLYEKGYSSKKNLFFWGSGFFVSASFLTKSAMIFFVVSLIGIIIIERIVKNITNKNVIAFYGGLISGFVVIDFYKFIAVGGLTNWINWWIAELRNMINQSGQAIEKPIISEKISVLSDIFSTHYLCALLVIVLPSIIYILILLQRIKSEKGNKNSALHSMCLWGVAGSSLEIFFILFGGSGLLNPRRHFVNEFIVKATVFIFLIAGLLWIIKKTEKMHYISLMAFFLISILIGYTFNIPNHTMNYITKKTKDDYDKVLMIEFLEEINRFDDNQKIYCFGWWQEPNITLFLDKTMYDINETDISSLEDESFFVVGRRFGNKINEVEDIFDVKMIPIDSIIVDYNYCFGYGSDELFSIYKIETK